MRRKVCALFLMCAVAATLFAGGQSSRFMIAGYQFTIVGRTDEAAVRRLIVPDGDEFFDSEEALVAALENKKQKLINLRVFETVEYTYTFTNESRGIRFLQVHFTIDDALAILPMPYAKYDSNYGFRLGLKLYDNNLFGKLANLYVVARVSQQESTFRKGLYYGEVGVTQMPIGRKVRLDLSTDVTYDVKDPASTNLSFKLNTQNMTIDNKSLSLAPWFSIEPLDPEAEGNGGRWGFTEVGNTTNLGPFALALGGFSLYNRVAASFGRDGAIEKGKTLTRFRFHGLKIGGKTIDTNISLETEGKNFGTLESAVIGETIGVGFSFLDDWLSWYGEVSQFTTMYPEKPLRYEFSFRLGNTLSHSDINWTGDFRKGVSLNLQSEVNFSPWSGTSDWYVEAMVTWFPFLTSWFNPSIRLSGRQTSVPKPFLPDSSSVAVGDYVRGVRLDNSRLPQDGEFKNSTAFVLNTNFMMKFISFGNFARTYVNPFMDFLLINEENDEKRMHFLATFGFEGIVVLNKFPSFPLRASIGFNLMDDPMEYELTIGMYMFF